MEKSRFLKAALFIFATVASVGGVHSQVTIGSLNPPRATLDVEADSLTTSKADGLLPPRLSAAQLSAKNSKYGIPQHGAIVYVTGISSHSPEGKTAKVNKPGYYYFDAYAANPAPGTGLWIPLGTGNASWFYLPSTKVDVRLESPQPKMLDIFAAYKEQVSTADDATGSALFGVPAVSYNDRGHVIESSGAPSIYNYLTWDDGYSATDFYYYVVGYDERVFRNIEIDDAGKMKYEVYNTADEATFINIVIVKK
jgi:hypothetical protein